MLTQLHAQNFKSWQDTGNMRMASLTGLFGTNSSGKTAIIQLLLMFKQTVESADRQRIIHTGDELTYIDLGTLHDIVHQHKLPSEIVFSLNWKLSKPLKISDPEGTPDKILFLINALSFKTIIEGTADSIAVKQFTYSFSDEDKQYLFGMRRKEKKSNKGKAQYELIAEGYHIKRSPGRKWDLPPPVKTYGFPDQVNAYYQNAGFLSFFVLAFEELFQKNIYYLGPLRDYPRRSYIWTGEKPQDVGRRGELAIPALLASRSDKISRGKGRKRITIEERVAEWLRELGLIYDFRLTPIAENRKEYEVKVRRSPNAPEVLITDVGFGVSQILPVLVLCYYAPQGSTIILEQPEIHLHPSVQAGLADVFIDAIKTRNVQIIVESHSEHLLRRLQRRIAEEKDGFSHQDAALYFCNTDNSGASHKTPLELDTFGNINNWPDGFFGDELGELVAMTEAGIKRQQNI
ncbi:AAA family ATPase [Cylindrospermum sp. FACHB-282]|uniref:AAA family ATPase n=1 Tax=Cylindrospermum sp. FACHB-282 TaxID=2692794 RepID=UPI001686495A|nr:DUF3696 domain-containing protein [Cylindrospermum sp. FACHB-282]MBD2386975.1 DUF3696 domain-containing protein [Cylindrospermum sp. FACHB-282]